MTGNTGIPHLHFGHVNKRQFESSLQRKLRQEHPLRPAVALAKGMNIIQLHKHLAQLARQRSFIHAAKVIAALNPITEPPQTFNNKLWRSERARTPRQIGVAEFAGPGVDVLEDEEGGPS